jgi:CubicO group peptidase (beta-lactamase class C family)
MNRNNLHLFSLANVILLAMCLPFYSAAQDSTKNRLDTYMQAAAKTGFNGNVLVAKNSRIIYHKAFGYRNLETRELLDNDSKFSICSVSKQFTAMGIMLLKKQHKLKLTDSLRQYFPELSYQNVTIENMLTHTSGLPNYQLLMEKYWDHSKIAQNNDLIKILAAQKPPIFFKPGQKYLYCNTAYVLLAAIIEKVSGQSFPNFMANNLFKPLHIRSSEIYSTYGFHQKNRPDHADGFSYSDSLKRYVPSQTIKRYALVTYLAGITGDGGVSTTTGDLLKWDRALKNNALLNKADQDSMFALCVLVDTPSKLYYGYGVNVGTAELGPFITHEGIWPGYRACLTRYTDRDITIIVLSNNESNAVGTSRALTYITCGKEVIPPYKHLEIVLDPQKLKPYVGTYLSPTPVELVSIGGKLYRHRAGTADIELKPESPTKFFYADNSDRQVEFVVDTAGNVFKAYLIANGVKSELVKQKS